MSMKDEFLKIFDDYKSQSVINLNYLFYFDLFTKNLIENYLKTNPEEKALHQASFSLYNQNEIDISAWLHTHNETFVITTNTLEDSRTNFFQFVINSGIVRAYNILEIFLLRIIRCNHYKNLDDPRNDKKSLNKLKRQIRDDLLNNQLDNDTSNNFYLINFLKWKSSKFENFLQRKMNIDNHMTYENFFKTISLLRHIMVHQEMMITRDVFNQLNQIGLEILNRYFFDLDRHESHIELKPMPMTTSINLFLLIDDFAGNCLKFYLDENNFEFIGLTKS
jgi:hypothetical protein